MLRKLIVLILFVSLLITQAAFYTSRQFAASNTEIMEMAAMLPESDVVFSLDFERTVNVAGPGLLNGDAKKIEHLMNLMRTIENEVGISPLEIKQITAGFKIPNTDSKDIFKDLEFTTIIRTANSNANLPDTWSKRIDQILKFKNEQSPSRQYMDEFRRFRDFKFEKATPEKIGEMTKTFQGWLAKTQQISAAADELPKISTDANAAANLKEKNKAIADSVNKYLAILKADTDMKALRESSIKLLNRSNAVTLDDPQRAAKLAALLKESQDIYPAYRKKFENAAKLKALINSLDSLPFGEESSDENFSREIESPLDKTIASLGSLPARKAAKTAELNAIAESLENTAVRLNSKIETAEGETEYISDLTKDVPQAKPDSPSFQEAFGRARREENVNGKRMMVIDLKKLDPPSSDKEKPTAEPNSPSKTEPNSNADAAPKIMGNSNIMSDIRINSNANTMSNVAVISNTNASVKVISNSNANASPKADDPPKKEEIPDLAIGFLDDKTMVIGFEKTIAPFLKRDPAYKNQKAVEMLGSAQNSLFAFALNSKLFSKFAKDLSKTSAPNSSSNVFDKLLTDTNIYGSVNYNPGASTNDIEMSLGFSRNNVEELIAPGNVTAGNDSVGDSTFEIAGYQVGKDIFYDLLNSFKAVQGSLTFRFEKKKVAGLVRSTPRIIEKIVARQDAPKTDLPKKVFRKPNKLESVQDLLTTPQLYMNLAELLTGKN